MPDVNDNNFQKNLKGRPTFSFVFVEAVAVEAAEVVPASPADIFAAFWALAFFRRPIVRPWVCPSLELSNALRLNYGRKNLRKSNKVIPKKSLKNMQQEIEDILILASP